MNNGEERRTACPPSQVTGLRPVVAHRGDAMKATEKERPMTRTSPALAILAGLLALGLNPAPAHAQQARSFVSGLGSDTNAPNCTRTAPCRTFQVAHDSTIASGEIAVLDAGSYGAVTISKNISIINDGVGEAGALVSGGNNGITINAGALDVVTLRGLTIKGIGFGGGNGIVFTSGLGLTLENCVVRNMTGAFPLGQGIAFTPTTFPSVLTVSNSAITENLNGGINVFPSGGGGGAIGAVLDRVGVYNNGGGGLSVNGANCNMCAVLATVNDSLASTNLGPGFWAFSTAGGAEVSIVVTNSVSTGNAAGLRADSNVAAIYVGASTLTNNGSLLVSNGGGIVGTFGDNHVINNLVTPAFTFGPILLK
jgi:hypothetical protein